MAVSALKELLVARNESIPLDVAALSVAAIEFPGLDARPSLNRIDELAAAVAARLTDSTGETFVAVMNQYLFQELGFRGNEEDYYNPRNSCLNEVLRTGTGIPISLSVVYMEVARRLNRRISGVGMPGHFLVRYQDSRFETFIDPFHGGRLLSAAEALSLSESVTGTEVPREVLSPVSSRLIVLRMLHNLRALYFRGRAYQKAIKVMDLLIAADPMSPEEYKQRGMLHQQLRQFVEARSDFGMYLSLSADPEDAEDIKTRLRDIGRSLAQLN